MGNKSGISGQVQTCGKKKGLWLAECRHGYCRDGRMEALDTAIRSAPPHTSDISGW